MPKFICLHGMKNNNIYINIDYIETISEHPSYPKTIVSCVGYDEDEFYIVNETPEEIIKMIEEAKEETKASENENIEDIFEEIENI